MDTQPALPPARDSGLLRQGQAGFYRMARLSDAGAFVVAGRVGCGRRDAVLDGALGLDADAAGIGGIPGAVRLAARPGVPAAVAAGLAPGCLGDGGGTARPARDHRVCARAQPPGVGCRVVARAAGLSPADARPAAKQGGAVPPPPPAAAGAHPQAVIVVIGDASVTTSTSSRESFAKARHKATSSQLSHVPWSSPVASSTTV